MLESQAASMPRLAPFTTTGGPLGRPPSRAYLRADQSGTQNPSGQSRLTNSSPDGVNGRRQPNDVMG